MTNINYEFKLGNMVLNLIEDLLKNGGIVTERDHSNGYSVLGWGDNAVAITRNGRTVSFAVLGKNKLKTHTAVISVYCEENDHEEVTSDPRLANLLTLADEVSADRPTKEEIEKAAKPEAKPGE